MEGFALYLGGIGGKQDFKQGPVVSDLHLENFAVLCPAAWRGLGWKQEAVAAGTVCVDGGVDWVSLSLKGLTQ